MKKYINHYQTIKTFLLKDVFYPEIRANIAIELLDNGNDESELERIYYSYSNYLKTYLVFNP